MQVLASGFLVADIIAADLPKVADEGELVFAPRGIQLSIGGHAANVSIDLRQLGVPAGQVGLVGAIGDDIFGKFIKETLESKEITAHLKEMKGIGTTKNIILVAKNQDRRFHLDLGATWHLEKDTVEQFLNQTKPRVFYIATGIVGKLDDELTQVLMTAKAIGSTTFVDIVRPFKKGWDFVIPALKFADVFHCNDLEAKQIAKKEELPDALDFLVESGTKVVFVTKGSEGAALMTKFKDYIEQGAFQVDAIDPTGAGDAFCAGIIFELIRRSINFEERVNSSELMDILMRGQAVGAACVTGIGTTTNVTAENVRMLIEGQGEKVIRSTRFLKGK